MLSIKDDNVKNKPTSLFVVPFGTTLNDFPISEWQAGGSKLLSELVIAPLSQIRINIWIISINSEAETCLFLLTLQF